MLPREYAKILSEKTGLQHIDLNQYMKVRAENTSRSSYDSSNQSNNHFNIHFKSQEAKSELSKALGNRPVLLVDDVITTGETLVATATILSINIPSINIIGGNALFAVETRTPTVRDLQRLADKLSNHIDPSITPQQLRQTIETAFSKFTRKKSMRYEIGTRIPEKAKQQYENIVKDISKMKTSIKESINGNLSRYNLDREELNIVREAPIGTLDQALRNRTVMTFYPDAKLGRTQEGNYKLFKDESLKNEISDPNRTHSSREQAVASAVERIQQNQLSQEKSVQQNSSIRR